MPINEQQIIIACQQGDWSNFDELYNIYINKIYKFIYLKTLHKEVAEDLTSQVFLKVVEKVNNFQASSNFSAWIYTLARNTVIDFYRSKKIEFNVDECWNITDNIDLPQNIDNRQQLQQVQQYLQKIPQKHREIIVMRVWGGMSFEEIAQITNKSEGGVKMSFYRLLRNIKKEVLLILFVCLVQF